MARITSNAEGTEILTAFKSDDYHLSKLVEINNEPSKMNEDGTGGNPMYTCTWEILDGLYKGRKVSLHRVMLGGKTKEGNIMPLRQLFEMIEAIKAPWATSPDASLVYRPFKRVKTDSGAIIFCDPDTNARITNIEYDGPNPDGSHPWLGRTAKIKYGVEKAQNSDREFNRVTTMVSA